MEQKYKVIKVGEEYQIFWCSSPIEEPQSIKYGREAKPYKQRQAAHRRCKQLNDRMDKAVKETDQMIARDGAIIL